MLSSALVSYEGDGFEGGGLMFSNGQERVPTL